MNPSHPEEPDTPGDGPGTPKNPSDTRDPAEQATLPSSHRPDTSEPGLVSELGLVGSGRVKPTSLTGGTRSPLPEDMSSVAVEILQAHSDRCFALLNKAVPPDGALERYERVVEELSLRDTPVLRG